MVSKRDLESFREAVEVWRDYFGISCFDVYIESGELEDGTIADVSRCVDTRSAVIRLHSLPPDEDKGEVIDSTARHEMIHVLLADFSAAAHSRESSHEMIEREEERLVVKLCRLFE